MGGVAPFTVTFTGSSCAGFNAEARVWRDVTQNCVCQAGNEWHPFRGVDLSASTGSDRLPMVTYCLLVDHATLMHGAYGALVVQTQLRRFAEAILMYWRYSQFDAIGHHRSRRRRYLCCLTSPLQRRGRQVHGCLRRQKRHFRNQDSVVPGDRVPAKSDSADGGASLQDR
jgi:hypothetical protein